MAVVVAIAAVVARVPVLALELQPAVGTIIRYNIISADKRNQATSFSSRQILDSASFFSLKQG